MKDALGHGSDAHGSGIENAVPHKDVSELRLFADNDANLYRQSKQPIEANLDKKVAKGVYDHTLATKLWGYHADRAAQAYHKEFGAQSGPKWHQMFPPAIRRAAASSWAESYRSDRNDAIIAARSKRK